MRLLYIGAGYVGSCSAAVAANNGHNAMVYDIDKKRIAMLGSDDRATIELCLSEPGLSDLLTRNKERINFSSDYEEVDDFLSDCDAVFICVNTPEIGETGESDLNYYNDALEKISESLLKRNKGKQGKYVLIVNKSTLPIDMADRTTIFLEKKGVINFGVASNPEFLVMGKAIHDSIKPDRIVVGAWTEKDFEIMREIYLMFYNSPSVKYIEVNPREAAAGKLLANFYLFNKLANCFDVMGRTCESFEELKFENIRSILSSDSRIGSWGLFDSLCAGGSCLMKDSRSLMYQLKSKDQSVSLINETYQATIHQLDHFIERAENEAEFDWSQKKAAILGLAFKRDTHDVRGSAAIKIANLILSKKVKEIAVYDPSAIDNFKRHFLSVDEIKYHKNEAEAIKDADVIIVATDWPQFRELAGLILQSNKKPLIMDGRRMLQHKYQELQNYGCDIIAVGSPFINSK